MSELLKEKAVRQLKHNDGSEGFVYAYDMDITDQHVADLQQQLTEQKAHVDRLRKGVADLQANYEECTYDDQIHGVAPLDYFSELNELMDEEPKQSLAHIQADFLETIIDKYDCGPMEYVLKRDLGQLREQAKGE